jgi:type IV secretion system protein VirB10
MIERRTNTDANYSGVERRKKSTSAFQKLTGFGAPKAKSDAEIEQDGMPSVGRRKGNNKLINILGIIVIIAAGAALAVAVNGDKKKAPKQKKEAPEAIANTLPPLIVPAAPVRLTAAPAPGQPTMQPASLNAGSGATPIALQGNSGMGSKGGATGMNGMGNMGGANGKPVPTWQDRKMGGMTLVSTSSGGSASPSSAVALQTQPLAADDSSRGLAALGGSQGAARGELAAKLEPTAMKGAAASLMPDRNYIVAKGSSLDCALETAIDSTAPGLTTCRLTRDVYSDNGQVVLLDRGTQLVGEYQGGIKHGQARLFVLWSRAKTPNGVIVNLNSPGTDALGRSGLEGWVDTHFLDRFGAALMISLIKDSYAYLIARETSSNGGAQNTLVLGNTAAGTDKMAEKALEATVNIPPTLIKNQGDHIQVMLARDLDFSTVYTLRRNK